MLKMTLRLGAVAALLVLCILVVAPAIAATTITVGSSSFNTYTDVYLTADSFPNGLAGYSGTLTVADPTKAEIQSVTHPSWALIHTTGAVPAGSVTISGLDTGSAVQSGATGTVIATVRLRAIGSGATTLGVAFASMDDDVGGAIAPATVAGPVTVTVMQGLTFSGAGAPTLSTQDIGKYYDEIEASNLSWAFAIGPIVPEPLVDMLSTAGIGSKEQAWRIVWFAVFGVMFLIMFLRQRNVLIPIIVMWVVAFFVVENTPDGLKWMISAFAYASAIGIIVYFAISRR